MAIEIDAGSSLMVSGCFETLKDDTVIEEDSTASPILSTPARHGIRRSDLTEEDICNAAFSSNSRGKH